MFKFSIIILFGIIKSSHSINYTYDSNISYEDLINSTVITRIINDKHSNKSNSSWIVSNAIHSYIYDGKIIQLFSTVNMSDSELKRICLPCISSKILEDIKWSISGTIIVATGSNTLCKKSSQSITLQQVILQIIDNNTSIYNQFIQYLLTQVCTGISNSTKDTCIGDDGNPLMILFSNRQWILIDLSSLGIELGYSGLYNRVLACENWMKLYINDSIWISESSSTIRTVLNTTSTSIELHAIIIETPISRILIVALFNFLLAIYL